MPDWEGLLRLVIAGGSVACGGIVVFGILGVLFALMRGKTLFRSLQFGIFVVMASLVLPGLFGVGIYASYNATSAFLNNAQEAQGVVVRLVEGRMQEGGIGYSSIVEFTSKNGSIIEFEDNSEMCSPACKQVGQQVTVLYDPTNPTNATISNPLTNWIWLLVFGILTAVFLIIGVWNIVDSFRKDKYWRAVEAVFEAVS